MIYLPALKLVAKAILNPINWLPVVGITLLGVAIMYTHCRPSKPEKPDRTSQIIEGVGGITQAVLDAQARKAEAEVRKAEAEARRAAAEAGLPADDQKGNH